MAFTFALFANGVVAAVVTVGGTPDFALAVDIVLVAAAVVTVAPVVAVGVFGGGGG